jgi:transcriptional regulator with XRE-family HTH domain
MSSPELIVQTLRKRMRSDAITYADLAVRIGMSESSVKRIFSDKDMSLTRLAQMCHVCEFDFDEIFREAASRRPEVLFLSDEQEKSLVADSTLMLVAICCLGEWRFEQILDTYNVSATKCIECLVKLDRLKLIELRADNKYRLLLSRTFRWRPHGPVQNFFTNHIISDYFKGTFSSTQETLIMSHGRISKESAKQLVLAIHRLASELAEKHQADQKLTAIEKDGFTLVAALQSWELANLTKLRKKKL